MEQADTPQPADERAFLLSEPRLLYVPLVMLDELWPALEPYLAEALEHSGGEYWPEDIYALVKDEKMQLWAVLGAGRIWGAGVTKVATYPRRKVLQAILCAGVEFDRWSAQAHAELEAFAALHGCECSDIWGRDGWVRKLKDFGYRDRYRVLRKVL